MKKISFTLLFLAAFTCFSQSSSLKRAHKYFKRTFYTEAIPLYEKALKERESFEAIKNLADAYYYTYNMEKATVNYRYLLKNYRKQVDETYYHKFANSLKALGEYKKANNVLLNYYKSIDNSKYEQLQKEIEYLEDVAALGNRFSIENLGINTPDSEFGAIQKGDTILFAAPRKEMYAKRFGWNGQNYLDIYQVSNNEIYLGDSIAKPFSDKINSKLHESNIIFTKDGKTAYFTRNNFQKGKRKTDDKKVTHVQLYKAELIEGEWQNVTSLPFNSNTYSTEHPALSPDEKTLYFASDMPNGFGGFDLYQVAIDYDGSFGKPQNLGPTVNTPKKEQFPFISEDNKLYFSSNGHPGFGSLDVFVSTISTNNFSKPDNVGFPVNSGYDDFSFNINTNSKEGFFSSNRKGGKGSDDIYKIIEKKPLKIESCSQFISGFITDEDSGEVLNDVDIVLLDINQKEIGRIVTSNSEKFRFKANCQTKYTIIASKVGYTKNQKTLALKKVRNKDNDASMTLKSLIILEREKRDALALKLKEEEILKRKNAEKLVLEKEKRANEIVENEKDIEKQKDRIVIKTDEISFDYNLWYLRRDSKKAIYRVINLMKKYPDMIVEVGTHSDIRGNNRYNLELSQKRATAVRLYFLESGIEPDRISAIGYGETQPLVKCKSEESCTEEQHEINRRCEFIVKKIL
ncbi:OmpA family protein [uncultured Tenacibaculum sp.]|uniref:OmpA family protein n=1 Tax=uncultured Tenacibaculum sp. TaxID=174713 RepID=UPI00260D31B6|nr:OmpA family protein [uncultured Tenacibaculum sp.]